MSEMHATRGRPILFSAPMVRAILAGTKTQTRRVVTPSNGEQRRWLTRKGIASSPQATVCRSCVDDPASPLGVALEHPRGGPFAWIRCPFGEPGDRLWVQETWRSSLSGGFFVYAATPGRVESTAAMNKRDPSIRWRPSIHMPRALSRITLEITDVRVERVQDISDEDALTEGILVQRAGPFVMHEGCSSARGGFAMLWDQINGKKAPWTNNPWVWALTFRRVETP